jgi:hypothetical protein
LAKPQAGFNVAVVKPPEADRLSPAMRALLIFILSGLSIFAEEIIKLLRFLFFGYFHKGVTH